MTIIKCKSAAGSWISFVDNNNDCFTGSQALYGSISIAATSLFFILTLLFKIFIFPLAVSINNPVGRSDTFAFPLFHWLRTFFCFLVISLPTVNYFLTKLV